MSENNKGYKITHDSISLFIIKNNIKAIKNKS